MFLSFDSDDTLSNVSETGTSNGLNQLTQYAGRTVTSDGKKNVSGYGSDIFTYSSENAMTGSVVGGTSTNLTFDPLLRLYQSGSGGVTSRFAYDGLDALAEYDGADALQRRWVFDPTTGQPVVWYEGSGTAAADRRYLSADERGSVISVSDSNGAALGISSYDEYGNPGASNLGRYGYTGQAWLAGAQLWYLNARMYSPAIGGRFMQPDPVGYAGGVNLYVYVGNDPVNFVDPLGLDRGITKIPPCEEDPKCILVVARRAGPAIGGAVRPPPPPRATPAQPKPTPKPKPRPVTQEESLCTAISGGALTAGVPDLALLGLHATRGATLAELFATGITVAIAPELLIIGGAMGVGLYLYDRQSGGKITNTFGEWVGC